MSSFQTIDDLTLAGQRVFVRVDLNVPIADGSVTDATRIEKVAPTIKELADKGAKVIVASHFGRPKGKADPALSLGQLNGALSSALGGAEVAFVPASTGPEAEAAVAALEPGGICLLENLRFDPGEEGNDPAFAAGLAELADIYINDAFSCSHRAHASIVGLAEKLPAAAGRLLQSELEMLEQALETPEKPVMAIVGGNKISTKLSVLGHLSAQADYLFIGGAMANTFMAARGADVGKSLYEADMLETARETEAAIKAQNCEMLLPSDGVVAPEFAAGAPATTVAMDAIPADQMVLDVGPETVAQLSSLIGRCKTLVWNGPLGAFETSPFEAGTVAVAQAAAALTKEGKLLSVAGGGDTMSAMSVAGVTNDFSYISTAGGAFLEWLEGIELPGVAVLRK